jgi:hypothetical protein
MRADYIAMEAFAFEMAIDDVAAGTGFVNEAQFDVLRREPSNDLGEGFDGSADDAVVADFGGAGRGDGDGDGFLVDVQTEVMHDFVHGCLVSFAVDESGATNAFHIADRPARAGNPRYRGIKHPLVFLGKP